ncbi:MAG: hypothetical protein KDI09_12600 [Halioglobus sp.]|nr:hypothetical protein [Halioglobus sp.]
MRGIVTLLTTTCFVVASLLSSAAQAGYFYEATSVATTEGGGTQTTRVSAWSEGPASRIEFTEGDNMGVFGPGSYLISTDGGETLFVVNPAKKTYSAFDPAQLMSAADEMMKSMGGMMQMNITDTHFEKVSEQPGDTLLGYATQRLEFTSGYTLSISVMGQKMNQVFDSRQTLWVTPAVDASALSAWLRPDKLMKGMFKGMGELVDAHMNAIKGAPLKSVIETTSTGGMGGGGKNIITTEVTALRKEAVDAARFTIPADYTETSLIDEVAGDDQQQDIGAGIQEGMSKLKGLFGGQ